MENTKENWVENLVKNILENESKNVANLFDNSNAKTLANLAKILSQKMQNIGAKIIENYCVVFDRKYAKEKPKNIVVKNCKKTRKIQTIIGEITLERKLYFDKKNSEYFFAFDDFWRVPKRQRIDNEIQAIMAKEATRSSYGKASAPQCLSRQTAFNVVKKIKSTNIFDDTTSNFINRPFLKNIFVEADEDHVHLQNKRNTIVKLVYVHEGRRAVCNGRAELINARYFVSIDSDNDKLWNDVADYVYKNYAGSRVNLSGDGASWIRQGEIFFPASRFRLDKFHTYKAITNACYGDKKVRSMIINAVNKKDIATIKLGFSYIAKMNIERSKRKQVFESMRYILNNLNVIDLSSDNFTCAEGHISHVLSSRMSSRPMGWSIRGAERIAKLRAYLYNGGDFLKLINAQATVKMEDVEKKIKPPYISDDSRTPLSLSMFDTTAKVVGFDIDRWKEKEQDE